MRRLAPASAWAVGGAYTVVYLYMLGDIGFASSGSGVRVAQWATPWLGARAAYQFEGIAMIDAGVLRLIVSPLNLAIAAALAGLVGANVHGAIRLRQDPPACRALGIASSAIAALPALLAGGACCAPALVLLLGLPGLGAVAGLFGWLVPLALIALGVTRWWQRRFGAPPLGPRWPFAWRPHPRGPLGNALTRRNGRAEKPRPLRRVEGNRRSCRTPCQPQLEAPCPH